MLLLVTDTSGKQGGVGLARAGEATDPDDIQVIEEVPLVGGTFSAQLVPQISALLSKHRLTKRDIDAFVVISGPGSFTGLRVGLAAIKALAEILNKPIVPVSLLEVMAVDARVSGKVFSAIDAGRGEVYVGEYEMTNGVAEQKSEQLLPVNEFLHAACQSHFVTTSDSLADSARQAGLPVSVLNRVIPEMIARLGWRKLRDGAIVSPEQLDANYIRRSDAEIFAKPTSATQV
ncbi:MAG TPA: tRNA (adenosine(37)-N6)-threonylcarbamoyltransferase complex dimerization subunit type 1 TsaB [Verrucomicrobiae bacterium]|jgi:tRNA threonylcarbamoyladenosine biosynthesis protein TsaB|nr:tRNA (adenosine(37)-N6)-threonylcarbamoyltransferase complex dimerization subunit type 1 TsaB [Verrucomicrobiae bacterium]